ncbi:hypothetical protein BJ170DRAFT_683101 [Xylariales sp. AK1849]|nr:hypothetical protein BJ170DRAFT_683101 [Xylariales sp. AK1849]
MLTGLVLSMLPLAVLGAPQDGSVPHPGPGVPNNQFELYAYGEGFGGLSVFNWGGLAYLGNVSLANDSEAANVVFTRSSVDTTTMVGNPEVTQGGARPSWSNATYFIPSDTTTHQTGFVEGVAATDQVTTGFVFYGNTAAWENTDGQLQTEWYALPYGDTDLWTLNWNSDGDETEDQVLVSLRSATPSTPPPNPPHDGGSGNPPTS